MKLLNMLTFASNNVFLRGVLLHYFDMNTSVAESYQILVEVYVECALAEKKWFASTGDFDFEDKERLGQPKNF